MFPYLPQGLRSSGLRQMSMKVRTPGLKEMGFWCWQLTSQILPLGPSWHCYFFLSGIWVMFSQGKQLEHQRNESNSLYSCRTWLFPKHFFCLFPLIFISAAWGKHFRRHCLPLRAEHSEPRKLKDCAKCSQLLDAGVQNRRGLNILAFFFPIKYSFHNYGSTKHFSCTYMCLPPSSSFYEKAATGPAAGQALPRAGPRKVYRLKHSVFDLGELQARGCMAELLQ